MLKAEFKKYVWHYFLSPSEKLYACDAKKNIGNMLGIYQALQ